MLPSCCHCRSWAHFLSVRHCRLKACWSIMLTNIMKYCTSKCCRHVLFNILEPIRALSTPYPQPSAFQPKQSSPTSPSPANVEASSRHFDHQLPPPSTSVHMATMAPRWPTMAHKAPLSVKPLARRSACVAKRPLQEAFNRCHMQPLEYIGREKEIERIENKKTGQNESK